MKPMHVHSYEWRNHESPYHRDFMHLGAYWPREYTTCGQLNTRCPQCGNLSDGLCWDCQGVWVIDWDAPDIPLEIADE
jgi:hypothetical protein